MLLLISEFCQQPHRHKHLCCCFLSSLRMMAKSCSIVFVSCRIGICLFQVQPRRCTCYHHWAIAVQFLSYSVGVVQLPFKIDYFNIEGKFPAVKVSLRCNHCGIFYGYSKYGNCPKSAGVSMKTKEVHWRFQMSASWIRCFWDDRSLWRKITLILLIACYDIFCVVVLKCFLSASMYVGVTRGLRFLTTNRSSCSRAG